MFAVPPFIFLRDASPFPGFSSFLDKRGAVCSPSPPLSVTPVVVGPFLVAGGACARHALAVVRAGVVAGGVCAAAYSHLRTDSASVSDGCEFESDGTRERVAFTRCGRRSETLAVLFPVKCIVSATV